MEVAMATDSLESSIVVIIAKYGIGGAVLAYFVYQDYMERRRRAVRDKEFDDRQADKEKLAALNDTARERDCVDAIRKVEAARTTELKEYLNKNIEQTAKINIIMERLLGVLENMEEETRTYRRKSHHNEG